MVSSRRRKSNTPPPMDFWISYSDLMAGLMMVFVLLLMGVLLVLRSEAEESQRRFEAQQQLLEEQRKELITLRAQVQAVLGIRAELFVRIKERFQDSGLAIEFDDATGAIRLGADVLFREGSYVLTEQGKRTLSEAMPIYFEALLGEKDLGNYVDRISIEGHTNSNAGAQGAEASYLFNLRLSQNRAYAALEHIIRTGLGERPEVRSVLVANGYSSSRLIMDPDTGQEDKERSRRIEVRFRLKDEETLEALENLIRQGVAPSPNDVVTP